MPLHKSGPSALATIATATALALILIALSATGALASATRAGTVIINQGHVTFTDLEGTHYQESSNIVETVVSAVAGVDITPGMVIAARPGDSARFEHTVTNTGNTPDFVDLSVTGVEGFTFEAGFQRGDSVSPDSGLLQPGESILLFLVVHVPASTPLSTIADFDVIVTSRLDGSITESLTDTVGVNDILPRVSVHGSPIYAYLGHEYTFDITFGNDGNIPAVAAVLHSRLADSLELVAADGDYQYDPATRSVQWHIDQIDPGQSTTYRVRVRVISATAGITYVLNRAELTVNALTFEHSEATALLNGAPSTMTLDADPKLVPGDGWSTSLLTAIVLDAAGASVPDGTLVVFHTELGTFRDSGRTYYATVTVGGRATAVLVAPILASFEQIPGNVVAIAGTPEAGEAQANVTVVFSPAGITGIVRDAATGLPVPGLVVELRNADGEVVATCVTDADGRYLLVAPAEGHYTVAVITLTEHGTRIIEMPVDVDYIHGSLFTTEGGIVGELVIVDAAQQRAAADGLAGVAVTLYGSDGSALAATVTDAWGEFQFSHVPLGDYTLIARSDDGMIAVTTASITEGGEILCRTILWMYRSGLVYDAETGAPVRGAQVWLAFASGPDAGKPAPLSNYAGLEQSNPELTDAAGRYIFYAPQGHYVVMAGAFTYEPFVSSAFLSDGAAVNMVVPLVRTPAEGLELGVTADTTYAEPGQGIRFELTWRNVADHDLADVVLVNQLPSGLEPDVASISDGGIYDAGSHSIIWTYPSAAAGAAATQAWFTASADLTTPDGTVFVNRAAIDSPDGSHDTAAVSVLVARKTGAWITKEADTPTANTGDVITYRIVVGNSGQVVEPLAVNSATVEDAMPVGFHYIPGSSRLDGAPVADPEVSPAGDRTSLSWHVGAIAVDARHELIYRASVGPDASGGDGVNTATLKGTSVNGYPFEKDPAHARVQFAGPAFSTQGAIVGRVYNTADGRGIAQAELLLDDGTRIVADADGLYHAANVAAGMRSIKLNLSAAGSPSRFVRVLPSEVAHADFAVALLVEADAFAGAVDVTVSSPELLAVAGSTATDIPVEVTVVNRAAKALDQAAISLGARLASGGAGLKWLDEPIISLGHVPAGASVNVRATLRVPAAAAPSSSGIDSLLLMAAVYQPGKVVSQANSVTVLVAASANPSAKSGTNMASGRYAIVSPAPQGLSFQGHISVRVTAPLNAPVSLTVNGAPVGAEKIGLRSSDTVLGLTTLEYVNVKLDTGKNTIVLYDAASGQAAATAEVFVPGPAASAVAVAAPTQSRLAVGAQIPAAVLPLDNRNLPAGKLAGVDAAAAGASFVSVDADPGRPGFQAIAGRYGSYDLLLAVTDPDHDIALSVRVGASAIAADAAGSGQTLNLRPLLGQATPGVAAGSAEVHLNLEHPEESYALGRAYLRKEYADSVLTLGIDTTRRPSIDVEPAYSLYGDNSEQSDAAPSQSMFYARYDKGDSYAMWGDFQSAFSGVELANLRSAFTGFSAGLELGKVHATAFAAPLYRAHIADRIQGNGTSGHYFLSSYPVVTASEIVRIVHTAPNDDSMVLDSHPLVRGLDYTINYGSGAILLAEPLPSTDVDGGKLVLEVSYSGSIASEPSVVAGARAVVDLGATHLGASTVLQSNHGDSVQQVVGLDMSGNIAGLGDAFVETALSSADEVGFAARAGLKLRIGQLTLAVDAAASDGRFIKPGDSAALPRATSANAQLTLDEAHKTIFSLKTENTWPGAIAAWTSTNTLTLGRRLSVMSGAAVGGAATVQHSPMGSGAIVDAFAQADISPELSAKASVQLLHVGVVQDPDGDLNLGLTYKTPRGLELTLAYSTAPTLSARMHSLSASLRLNTSKTGQIYSKISLPFGPYAAAASVRTLTLGYKDTLQITPGLKLLVAAEGSAPLAATAGPGAARLAASGTLDYTAPTGLHAYAKHEFTLGQSGRTNLTQLGVEGKAGHWLNLRGEMSAYAGTSPTREGLPLKVEVALSAAARPLDAPASALLKLTGKYYSGERFGRDEITAVAIASVDSTFDVGRMLSLDTKAAVKMVADGAGGEAGGLDLNTSAVTLLQAGPSMHLGSRTDLEGFVRALGWAGTWRTGYSVQLAYTIVDGFRLGVGYNSADLSDTDIPDSKPWKEGFYFKVMLKI